MQLEGNLKQFPLSELLSMIVSTAVTGVLEVSGAGEVGQVFCIDGRLYHAAFGEHQSMAAIERMLELREAQFVFISGVTTTDATLPTDSWLVIGMVMRQERLLLRIRDQIPGFNWVPVLRADGLRGRLRLPAEVWPIIASVDGDRSLRDMAGHLRYDLHQVARVMHTLACSGLVTMRPPRQARLVRLQPLRTQVVAQANA